MGDRPLRRVRHSRWLIVGLIAAAALLGAAVGAFASGGSALEGLSGAVDAAVEREAALRGVDPALLGALASEQGSGDLRTLAGDLRTGIDHHQSVVAAVAALIVDDELVTRWLASNPALSGDPTLIPDRGVRSAVERVFLRRDALSR